MKKLFTLVAFLACFLGAKAEWVTDYEKAFSSYNDFPFYVMGYAPSIIDGIMVDNPVPYRKLWRDTDDGFADVQDQCTQVTVNGNTFYEQALESNPWRQYFVADGIPTEIDGSYTVKAVVKVSQECTVHVNMGNWSSAVGVDVKFPASDDFQEIEWEHTGIAVTSCFLIAQPGVTDAVIEWKSITVGHNQKAQRPTTWQEWMTSDGQPVVVETTPAAIANWMGNAETPWADPNVKFNDQEKNYLICAWGKEKGVNMNENDGWDPFPATIESEEVDGKTNHYFIVHGQPATTEGDASAWDNQFWIQSPKEWKAGETVKIHFRYKASKDVKVATQCHKQNPSDYLIWHAIGDVEFTTTWKEFDSNMTIGDDMGGTWSIAFQLNQNDKDAIDFYFDDLSWQSMVLDEGYFVAGCNTTNGLEYDLDNAIEFQLDEEAGCLVAVVGEKGKADTYVNQLMISTVRGNDASFKSNTLKPSGSITNDPDNWMDYTASSIAKLTLPGSGVWKVYLDTEYKAMAFEMLEGEIKDPIDIVTNTTAIVVHGQERDWLGTNDDGSQKEEGGVGQGQPWDNQFWFVANRTLSTGEVTVLKFKYKASKEAKTSTQCHGNPGGYLHWAAIGDVNFTEEWQDFEADFTVPSEANDMKSIAFNMAEIKEACDYEIKDVQWYLKDDVNENGKTWENLINETGTENFFVKEGAGTEPYQFGGGTGINNVVNNKNTGSAVIYNLAGQRVSKDYKGIVVKDNKKVVLK
jgi:hypothetical protein